MSDVRRYLKRLHIDAFGLLSQADIGPFGPNMNVVYGANEAGKTTLSSFISGVLFGWEDARGQRNPYKPANAERSGQLVFAARDDDSADVVLSRVRNVDGVSNGEAVLSDIEKDTFKTIFSLDSDELRGLGRTGDVTARLLTAGAGTEASPARVLSLVDARIAACMSRSQQYENSIPLLQQKLANAREQLAASASEADRFMQEDRELHDLEQQRVQMQQTLEELNRSIETYKVQRDALKKLLAQRDDLAESRSVLDAEERDLHMQQATHFDSLADDTTHMDAVEESIARESIDEMVDETMRLDHVNARARQDSAQSKASYEALLEADDIQALRATIHRQRTVRIMLSIGLPLGFLLAGVPVFMYGRQTPSLSLTALGTMLIVSAIFIAVVAVVTLFRPNKTEEAMQERLRERQWVMLQDQKKLEASEADVREYAQTVAAALDEMGLPAAQGSLKRARILLDKARDARAESNLFVQRQQSLVARLTAVTDATAANEQAIRAAFDELGETGEVPLSAIDDWLALKSDQRSTLMITLRNANARYGELRQELRTVRSATTFAEVKTECAMLQARLDDKVAEYAQLLLARRMLEASIAAWESKSQPLVYQQAGQLLSMMTDGAWTQILCDESGRLQAMNAVDQVRDPNLLSTGTCQQMYLALRIALLATAENVGRSIPVLADDILVHFDGKRRKGAARALALLAQNRQVILFTCHEEVVTLMQEACEAVNLIRL